MQVEDRASPEAGSKIGGRTKILSNPRHVERYKAISTETDASSRTYFT